MIQCITTHRSAYASASVRVAACVAMIFFFLDGGRHDAHADDQAPAATASMQCERAAEPGRVKCSIELHTTANRSIAWADVAIIELPDFASALKGRIGPSDATTKEPTQQKWAFGLVAKKTGQGEAKARVRAVVCDPQPNKDAGPTTRCTSTTVDVKATIQVG
jgi:hypothetical protein